MVAKRWRTALFSAHAGHDMVDGAVLVALSTETAAARAWAMFLQKKNKKGSRHFR